MGHVFKPGKELVQPEHEEADEDEGAKEGEEVEAVASKVESLVESKGGG